MEEPPIVSPTVPVSAQSGAVNKRLLTYMLLSGLAGGALGAGVTGSIGHNKLQKRQPAIASTAPTTIPYPQLVEEKQAEEVPFGGVRHLLGAASKSLASHPLAVPALATAGIGGTLLGSHLANKHYHDKMKAQRQAELAAAQAEYEQAMFGMYNPHNIQPLEEKIGAALDVLCDMLEKRAINMDDFMGTPTPSPITMNDFMSTPKIKPVVSSPIASGALGPIGVGLAGVGALGAYGGYHWAEGRKPENLLSKAIAQRAMLRAQASPEPVQLRVVGKPAMEQEGKKDKKDKKE